MKVKDSRYWIFDSINYTLLMFIALLMIFPFWNILMTSFTAPHLVYEGRLMFWPQEVTFVAYETVFQYPQFLTALQNTIFITIIGTLFSMFLTIILSYPLSKKYLKGSQTMMFLVFFTMLFSGGIIPTYILVKSLGLLNTLWSLVIPHALSAFNVIIMVTFFRSIEPALEDSARIDGCNDISVLFRIIVPTSMPIIATLTLFYAVSQWNVFFHALMFISDSDKMTLQVLLRQILIQLTSDSLSDALQSEIPQIAVTVKMSLIIIATLPIMLVYPFLQKYFTQGIMIGSIKG